MKQERLNLYRIDMKYIRNMHNIDNRVSSVSPQTGKQHRIYVGTVVVCNEHKYLIPLSVTYKLKLSGGDIKAVQGDSGHAQADMVTEVYGHILDEDRKKNARLMKVLGNPEMAALLTSLAKSMKG